MTTSTTQDVLDRACEELGLPTTELALGNVSQIGVQALALLNSLGDDLVRIHDWQFLEGTATLTGDGATTEFALPSDFGRIVNQTTWATSNRMPIIGPLTSQEWGWVNFGIVSVGVFYRYRILGNQVVVSPAPAADEIIKFYYIKKNWVLDNDGTTLKDSTDAGDDTPQFDRGMLVKGLKVRLWAQKGFDTTQLSKEYNDFLDLEKAQNQGSTAINISGSYDSILLDSRRNIPDGNW